MKPVPALSMVLSMVPAMVLAIVLAGMCQVHMTRADQAPGLQLQSQYIWRSDHEDHGGYSGLELGPDGRRFWAITDRGRLATGLLRRDPGMRIIGVKAPPPVRMLDTAGKDHPEERYDSEGLALGEDGRFHVSFEGLGAIWSYRTPARAEGTPRLRAAKRYPNAGIEALAIDPQGRIVAIPERSGALTRPFPVFRLEDGGWTHIADLPRRGGFLAVGADFGPDGRLYLLERQFSGWAFRSRVRRFTFSAGKISDETTLLESRPFQFDNLEGISIWRDDTERLRMTLISDDNFSRFQRTQIVEFTLPDETVAIGATSR